MAKNKDTLETKLRDGRHHVIPKSRGGSRHRKNIAVVDSRDHRFYHALFENKVPEEIIQYLVNDFWKGDWSHVKEAYEKYNE